MVSCACLRPGPDLSSEPRDHQARRTDLLTQL